MLRLNKTILKTLLLATTGTVISLGYTSVAQAGILTFNSISRNSDRNAQARSNWLNTIGIMTPQNLVDFETGFADEQNISGENGLFPNGLLIKDTSAAQEAVIQSGSRAINGSNPIGNFALTQNEEAFLVLDFSNRPVDYVGFYDIDHTGTRGIVTFTDGTTTEISLDRTTAAFDSAEFFGIFRNDMPRIVSIQLDASGDGLWAIDNIEYGAVPEPLTIVGAGTALGFGSFFKRRLSKNQKKKA